MGELEYRSISSKNFSVVMNPLPSVSIASKMGRNRSFSLPPPGNVISSSLIVDEKKQCHKKRVEIENLDQSRNDFLELQCFCSQMQSTAHRKISA